MGRSRELWWIYVKKVIRQYPAYQKEIRRIKESKITPTYSKGGGVGKSCRKTELIALRSLPECDQERYEAVEKALQRTGKMPDGDLRLKFIQLTYFTREVNIEGAAMRLYVSRSTALRWNMDFMYMVARYLKLT